MATIYIFYYYFNDFLCIYINYGLADPPPWPNHLQGPKWEKTKLGFGIWGWPNHPRGPRGWFGYPQTGWFGGGQKMVLGVVWPKWGWLSHLSLYIYINEIIKIIIKIYDSHVSIEVYHGDRCRACTPTHVGCHGWTLILDEKMDGGYISIFSYTTCTTYNKK
jgi:hypothetical protein